MKQLNFKSLCQWREMQIQSLSSLEPALNQKEAKDRKLLKFAETVGKALKSTTDGGIGTQAKPNKIFKSEKSWYDICLTIPNSLSGITACLKPPLVSIILGITTKIIGINFQTILS